MAHIQSPDDEISRLLAENEALRARLAADQVDAQTSDHPRATHRPGRWRAPVAAILIVLGVLLAPTAVITAWVKTELTDTSQFVDTLGPLADDPAVQAVVVDEIVNVINENVDFQGITSDLFNGLATLNLPPRAAAALQLLEQPAVQGMQSLVRSVTERVVASPAFAATWRKALEVSHTQMLNVLQGDTSGAIVLSDSGELGIQLGPIIDAVKTQLVDQGLTLAANIPEINRTIPIAQADSLVQARTAYTILDALGYWLPIISLILMAAGVVIAKKRARALIWTGVSVAVMMVILGSGIAIGRIIFVSTVAPTHITVAAAQSIYDAVIPFISNATLSLGLVALGVAIVAYLAGPFRGAQSVRRLTTHTAARLRASAESSGVTTGRFGEILYANRRWIRVGIAVCAAAVVLFVRPLTTSVIVWTAVLALLLVLLLELLQRPVARSASNGGFGGSDGPPGDVGDDRVAARPTADAALAPERAAEATPRDSPDNPA